MDENPRCPICGKEMATASVNVPYPMGTHPPHVELYVCMTCKTKKTIALPQTATIHENLTDFQEV